jgi:hypothetical protein
MSQIYPKLHVLPDCVQLLHMHSQVDLCGIFIKFQEMKESVQSDLWHQVSLLVQPMLQVNFCVQHKWRKRGRCYIWSVLEIDYGWFVWEVPVAMLCNLGGSITEHVLINNIDFLHTNHSLFATGFGCCFCTLWCRCTEEISKEWRETKWVLDKIFIFCV